MVSGNQTTRLGNCGGPRPAYAVFQAKADASGGAEDTTIYYTGMVVNVGRLMNR